MAMNDEDRVMPMQDSLIYVANQIARPLAAAEFERLTAMVPEHIRNFRDPLMRQRWVAPARDRADEISPIAGASVARFAGN